MRDRGILNHMRLTLTANNRMHRTPSTTTRNTGETEREGKESPKAKEIPIVNPLRPNVVNEQSPCLTNLFILAHCLPPTGKRAPDKSQRLFSLDWITSTLPPGVTLFSLGQMWHFFYYTIPASTSSTRTRTSVPSFNGSWNSRGSC